MVTFSYNLGKTNRISDAETYAVLKAVKEKNSCSHSHTWHIFSDSKVTLYRIGHITNMKCHQIRKECFRKSIYIYWCPGHMNIEENDLNDKLAISAHHKMPVNNDVYVTHSHLKQKSKEIVLCLWKDTREKELLREEGRKARALENSTDYKQDDKSQNFASNFMISANIVGYRLPTSRHKLE